MIKQTNKKTNPLTVWHLLLSQHLSSMA